MEKKRKWVGLKSILNLKSVKCKALQVFLLQIFLLVPWGVMALDQKVTIHLEQVKVQEIFKEINKQTGLNFVYSAMQLNEIGMVSLNVKDVTVDFALKKLFEGKPFTYKFEMQSIIIRKIEVMPKGKTSRTIRGVITDKAREPLPGVTVLLKGTSVGTASNMEGEFALEVMKDVDSLVVTFVGMKTQYVKLRPEISIYKIQMEYDVEEMDEVVITGYQTIDKRKNTSAVQTLQMDDIKVPGVTRVDQLLEGHVPGMTFMQNSGQVGAAPKLRVRGTSTILGNQEPVWVLDGIILRDPVNVSPTLANNLDFVNLVGNAISGINPDDIERIDILKDASATALYGAKAANGVIVITTKKGKAGAPSVTYNVSGTYTRRPRYTDNSIYLMNSKERVAYSRELVEKRLSLPDIQNYVGYEDAINKLLNGVYTYEQFQQEVNRIETVNTDWFKLITEDSFSHNHTLSLSGGSENVRYYASLGYSDEKGVIKKEKNDRYSTLLKVNGNFDKLAFNFMIQANRGERHYANSEVDILNYAYNTARTIPAYNEDGSLYYYTKSYNHPEGRKRLHLAFNALNEMANCRDEYNTYAATVTTDLNYRFNENLKAQLMFSYGMSNTTQETFMNESSWYAACLRGTDYGIALPDEVKSWSLLPMGGEYREDISRNDNYTARLQLDYNKFLDKDRKHLINASVGFELSSNKYGWEKTNP
jgi:TonB-linked SusC/RagA family outer membrane protein